MQPKVSVIIPVYNREGLVLRTLESVLNQSCLPEELIVVDNNSTDSTYTTVQKWMEEKKDVGVNFKLLKEEEPGVCAARQKGLDAAEGEFVIFFDSDDIMLPDLISEATSEIKKNASVEVVCWKCRINLLDGSIKIPRFIPGNPLESHLIHSLLRPQGYIINKGFLIKMGGWKKPIKVWNDLELGLRIILGNPRIKAINKVLSEIYAQEKSITGKSFSAKIGEWEETLEEMARVNESFPSSKQKKISGILHYRKAILASQYYKEGKKEQGARLLKETIKNKSLKERFLLLFSYHYTRKGFRGAWNLIRYAY